MGTHFLYVHGNITLGPGVKPKHILCFDKAFVRVGQLWIVGSFLLLVGFSVITVSAGALASLSYARQQPVVGMFGFH